MKTKHIPMKLSLKLLATLVSASFCLQVSAATFTVMNTSDSGAGSFRLAISDSSSGDTINFNSSLNGQTITLTSGELLVNKNLTITGPGANQLAINGNAASRVFNISSGITVTIFGLTITNGNAGFGFGGGIYNQGTLTITNCTLSGNSATTGFGGGIANGGIAGASMRITNSTLSGNSAGLVGGGIYISYYSTLIVLNSTLSGNSAASDGGGIYNNYYTTLAIFNSTLSGNSATYNGGSIYNRLAELDISDTILTAGASGENIFNLSATVISWGYNLSNDAAGGDATTGPGGLLNATGDQRNTDPLLGPLQDNGGPTFTHALLVGSPAIDAGDPNFDPNNFTPPLITDQRGSGFARVVNSRVDIGAFEVQQPPYAAQVQQPINPDGSSVFNVRRGVVPVKFTLTQGGVATCALPPATIALTRTSGGTTGAIDESVYVMAADTGSNFRIDSCQYVYNLSSGALGVGTYRVDIMINGQVVGSGSFQLK